MERKQTPSAYPDLGALMADLERRMDQVAAEIGRLAEALREGAPPSEEDADGMQV